jgi:hypothetical protein
MGYSNTRAVPLHWLWFGAVRTLLESWNANWNGVATTILLKIAFIRCVRPHVQIFVQNFAWVAFTVPVCMLIAVLPVVDEAVDCGAEGWLWALFGFCQRVCVGHRSASNADHACQPWSLSFRTIPIHTGAMRLLACLVAAIVHVWHEQKEYSFPQLQFAVFLI